LRSRDRAEVRGDSRAALIAALAAIGHVPNAADAGRSSASAIYARCRRSSHSAYFLAGSPDHRGGDAEIKAGITGARARQDARDPLTARPLPARAHRRGDPRLLRRASCKVAASDAGQCTVGRSSRRGALLVFSSRSRARLGSPDTEPGSRLMCVVGGGFALTAACFHALRLRRAREMQAAPVAPEIVRMHLEGITSAETRLDRAA
jgi:hypothetical protein